MTRRPRIGYYVAGINGAGLLVTTHNLGDVAFVCSYDSPRTLDRSGEAIATLCAEHGYRCCRAAALAPDALRSADLIFVGGWQYLHATFDARYVVFHDALLPRYRGFAPTPTALINGESRIGVTAIAMSDVMDAGPIYTQHALSIAYPTTSREAYQALRDVYSACARDVVDAWRAGTLTATPQDETAATYSVWRGADDLRIHWALDAARIARFVDAVGWPFEGARSMYRGREIVVRRVEVAADLYFEERHPGKIWAIRSNHPEIICGSGMLRIVESAYADDATTVEYRVVRERLGSSQ